jgi:hypothetical protein
MNRRFSIATWLRLFGVLLVLNTAFVFVVECKEAPGTSQIAPSLDSNWISMGGFLGTDGFVFASVVDGSGNLYIGGTFTVVADVQANRIAKWNGTNWSALGSGFVEHNSIVTSLAVSGNDVYAGVRSANRNGASSIFRWDGTNWAQFGPELNKSHCKMGWDQLVGAWFRDKRTRSRAGGLRQ